MQNHLPRRRTDGTGSGAAQIAAAIQVHAAALPAGVKGAACAAVAAGGSLYHAFAMYCQGRTVGQLYRAFQAVAAGVGVGSAVGSGVAVGSAVGDGVAAGSSAVSAARAGAAASRVSGAMVSSSRNTGESASGASDYPALLLQVPAWILATCTVAVLVK